MGGSDAKRRYPLFVIRYPLSAIRYPLFAIAVALALAACSTAEPADVAATRGALIDVPIDAPDAPVVIDGARIDRVESDLRGTLAATDDPEARMDARVERFRAAEAELHRDETLDRRSAIETAAAIRARILGSDDARQDAEAAERARIARGEPTRLDLRGMPSPEAARAAVERRIGIRPLVPAELRTPEGVATPTAPPTEEELRHAPVP